MNRRDFLKRFALATAACVVPAVTINELFLDEKKIGNPARLHTHDISFSDSGERMYIKNNSEKGPLIYAYRLTTPWDISTASYSGVG